MITKFEGLKTHLSVWPFGPYILAYKGAKKVWEKIKEENNKIEVIEPEWVNYAQPTTY